MSNKETTLRVFVSSPSDVKEERQILEEIVRELNITWSRNTGIRLDLIRWETHVSPGIGEYPQDVINSALGDDYDIFIGILWKRFGSPTLIANSGTEEEFERAYSLFRQHPHRVKIMFYFSEAPISPSEIDPSQLALIQAFKKKLGERGALYRSYSNYDEFASLLRMHLSLQIQQFETGLIQDEQSVQNNSQVIDQEEEGFLDLFERSEYALEEARKYLRDMNDDVSFLGEGLVAWKRRLATASSRVAAVKEAHNEVAEIMERFVENTAKHLPPFSQANKTTFDSYARGIALFLDFRISDTQILENKNDTLKSLKETMTQAGRTVGGFHEMVKNFPRVTTKFNHARRRTLDALNDVKNEFDSLVNLIEEAESITKETIRKCRERL